MAKNAKPKPQKKIKRLYLMSKTTKSSSVQRENGTMPKTIKPLLFKENFKFLKYKFSFKLCASILSSTASLLMLWSKCAQNPQKS